MSGEHESNTRYIPEGLTFQTMFVMFQASHAKLTLQPFGLTEFELDIFCLSANVYEAATDSAITVFRPPLSKDYFVGII